MSYKTITGKGGISATIVADSVSVVTGTRITTMELVYHRFIHAEFMTHRQFSRNAMSSRAVPVERMIELVETSPAIPIHWGAKQSGMQADSECNNSVGNYLDKYDVPQPQPRHDAWIEAADDAVFHAKAFNNAGYHKQIVNRLTEPFQLIKVLVTATEFDNFFNLRLHSDAQPEIQELARVMYEVMQESEPEVLQTGEWHTPYVDHLRDDRGELRYTLPASDDDYSLSGYQELLLEEALKVSASCAAMVSYRRLDTSLEKATSIYDKLIGAEPKHYSPFEHQACVMQGYIGELKEWEDGVTHIDRNGSLWSGNFKDWLQHRHTIEAKYGRD